MMNPTERDQKAYQLAKEYLLQFQNSGITPKVLEDYLDEYKKQQQFDSIGAIYQRLLESAKNANSALPKQMITTSSRRLCDLLRMLGYHRILLTSCSG